MISSDIAPSLAIETDSRIVLLVMDGLGGFPNESGKTELETAHVPNLDRLAAEGATGLMDTLGRGVTPGSGLAHLALFGYDSYKHDIGRGAIAANGIGLSLTKNQVAARLNFCTERDGKIADRRAGRIPTEKCAELCTVLNVAVKLPGVKVAVHPVMDYRAVVVFDGPDLSIEVADTDPGVVGVPAKPVKATKPEGERMAKLVAEFVAQAKVALASRHPANMILLRGFARHLELPSMRECYKLKAACIATYPDYRGVARMVGMDVLPTGDEIADEFITLKENWAKGYTFFFVHVKKTDSYGEDGDFVGRVHKIEEVDALIPRLMELGPDVLVVTGDHSTPAMFKAHTWHPVPAILWGKSVRRDETTSFGEREAMKGSLGRFDGAEFMLDILAHAGKLKKMGA